MNKAVFSLLYFLLATMASGATLKIPSAEGPLTVDGLVDEEIWSQAAVLPLQPADFGAPFPAGGEIRAVVRRGYLCLSARLPESRRIVAKSTGPRPVWLREDLVVWTFRFLSSDPHHNSLTLSVNPLGAYSVEPIQASEDRPPVEVSASIGSDRWSVEAAIPLDKLGKIGFASVERIRAARPDAPELRWHWPGANDSLDFELAATSNPEPPPVAAKNWVSSMLPAAPATSSDPVARELASVPHQVWTEAERMRLGVERMWEKDLRSRLTEAALAERHDWEKVATLADWEEFRDRRLAALKASLGPFPERTPLSTVVTRRINDGDGFILENIVFESRPGLTVTANLYLPAKATGRVPAIVVVHSHHAPKIQPELQDMGMTWARSGAAVLIMDQLGAGERLQTQPWPRESYYSRYALGTQLYLVGESLMKWMVWDLMRGIDLLLVRPEVDPSRIIMLGAVAGGGDPAAVTAALDTRIAAVLPFNFGEAGPEEHYTEGPRRYDSETADPGWGEWESTRCLRESVAGQFFPWFICASVAPRRFVYSFEVSWPNGVEREPAWARYGKVFALYGRPDRLAQVDGFGPFPGPGECTNVGVYLRKKIYPILKRWLDVPIPPKEYHNVRPDRDLTCLTPEAAAERRPTTVSEIARGMAEERLAAARAKLASLAEAERLRSLRASLKTKLGDIEPSPQATARVTWTKRFSDFVVEGVELQTAPGLAVPLLLIKPGAGSSQRLPLVLALAEGGKRRFLAERSAELAGLLKQGIAVCLADVRGTGELEPSVPVTDLAATEAMLGSTALGVQLKDARTVLRYLSARRDLDPRRVVLWGDSFARVNPRGPLLDQSMILEPGRQQPGPHAIQEAQPLGGLLVLLTTLFEDNVRGVVVHRGLVSYLSVLKDRFCYVPQDVAVPGILQTADLVDVIGALSPRATLLDGLVDGRDRPLSLAEMEEELRGARTAYQRTPSHLVILEQAPGPALVQWMAALVSR
jgi:dienelactone hydrolase